MDFADTQEFLAYKRAVDEAQDESARVVRSWNADIAKSKKAIADIKPEYDKLMAVWQPLNDEYRALLAEYRELQKMMEPSRAERRFAKWAVPVVNAITRSEELEKAITSKTEALAQVDEETDHIDQLRNTHKQLAESAEQAMLRAAGSMIYLGHLLDQLIKKHGKRRAFRNILKLRAKLPQENSSTMKDKEFLERAYAMSSKRK